MVEEARLEEVDSGAAPLSEGWFVVNVRDAAWLTNDAFGGRCVFEATRPVLRRRPDLHVHTFPELGAPCVIFMIGRRSSDKEIVYPRSERALSRGVGVETETSSPAEAYAPFPDRPERWGDLHWVQ